MQTCKTCLHRQPYNVAKGVLRGDCRSGDERMPCVALDPSNYRPLLATRADFGCVAHEPAAVVTAEAPETH